ncbi:TPA: hypothetical protein DEP86_03285, partial [Candidatus Uhrbacteria bacterium]|nr:hypothetical protein [Candidatus Uhrbacteria bacterium]
MTGTSVCGGLFGYGYNAITWYSSSNSTVSCSGGSVGGLIGASGNADYTYDSFATGAVTGSSSVGGLAGAYWIGSIAGSYWDVYRTGQASCSSNGNTGCTGKNSGNSEPNYWFNSSTNPPFNAWNFNGLWKTNGASYPTLNLPIVTETTAVVVTTDTTP